MDTLFHAGAKRKGRGQTLLADPLVPESIKIVLELGLDLNMSVKRIIHLLGFNYSTMFSHKHYRTIGNYLGGVDQERWEVLHQTLIDMHKMKLFGLRRSVADDVATALFENSITTKQEKAALLAALRNQNEN